MAKKRKAIDMSTSKGIASEEIIPEGVISRISKKSHPELLKYWNQRYRLFLQFDDGIWLDKVWKTLSKVGLSIKESWYSVTPELISEQIAKHIYDTVKPNTIIDPFCGSGGNAIQLARFFDKVLAIDIDPLKLDCAKHNAEIYGVADKISFLNADFFAVRSKLKADAIFLSPPWGGPGYIDQQVFDLEQMSPYKGSYLYDEASKITSNIALYIPRSCSPEQVVPEEYLS
ncbi:Trimethylguanosine synthase [Neolecta irregularis DAH-3]|uniref:Trimethylguanosine synthase n=1 Tax=Neolecta irregularis (strain DAH-3) TaxID=1198029 RepID=A0A1U7LJ04_NEOID|nr:Trimethylguanosine synthase [Neolecta irregularis DAH-3]|eukprot:OLL22635.1 Trimethylguanosine synthase [Neolecta irregularis DAH-3]